MHFTPYTILIVRDGREESNKNKGAPHEHWGTILDIYTIICIGEGIVLMVDVIRICMFPLDSSTRRSYSEEQLLLTQEMR